MEPLLPRDDEEVELPDLASVLRMISMVYMRARGNPAYRPLLDMLADVGLPDEDQLRSCDPAAGMPIGAVGVPVQVEASGFQ